MLLRVERTLALAAQSDGCLMAQDSPPPTRSAPTNIRGLARMAALGAILMASPALAAQTVCAPKWGSSESTNTSLLQAAIKTCSAAGSASEPGLVDLTSNGSVTTAQISSVKLASNIVIKVESGFTLQGPNAADVDYTGSGSSSPAAILTGSGLSNVTITGTGVIDGNGSGFWTIFNKGGNSTKQDRPKLIKIAGAGIHIGANFSNLGQSTTGVIFPTSTNSTTGTLKIKNGPTEMVAIESGSSNVMIDGTWIYAPTGRSNLGTGDKKNIAPNTDGIDIIGTNTAVVQNSLIDTGDDDVAIKSNAGSNTTTNITVRASVLGGGHGLSIGGQEAAGVSNVSVTGIWFLGTDFGFKIKTDNTSEDSGITNTVTYQNSCMLNVGEPLQFTYNYDGSLSGGTPPTIETVKVINLIATSASTAGVSAILGSVDGLKDDLENRNISITQTKITGSDADPFNVSFGTLTLGGSSTIATKTATQGTIVKTTDVAPTVVCPSSITIPKQL
jgi:polygalacturonase